MAYQGMDEDKQLLLTAEVEFEQYLDSDVILWRLSGSKLPLCPGNFILATLRQSVAFDSQISGTSQRIETLKNKRLSAWYKKIEAEIPIRLNQWKTYLEDLHDNGRIDKTYRYNIRTRVILDLLFSELDKTPPQVYRALHLTDALLAKITKPGDFIWEEELSVLFSQSRFPYLFVAGK